MLAERDGPPALPVYGIGQDTTGYLWLATESGVGRYDGVRFTSWSERAPRERPMWVVPGRDGEVLVLDQGGALFRIGGISMEPATGPDGSALADVDAAAFGPDRALWVCRARSLLVRRRGNWSVAARLPGTRTHDVAPVESGDVLVASDAGVHRLAPDGTATLLDPWPLTVKVLALDGDDYAILLSKGSGARLVEVSGGERRVHEDVPGRPIDVVRRRGTLWVSTDRYLAAFRPGRPPEIMGPEDGLPSGGPLLVDREGSLWLGTFVGLLHFPEPDTILLNDSDGLPSSHTLYLNQTGEGIWLSTWQGSALVTEGKGGIEARPQPTRTIGRGCVDARGTLWSSRTDWSAGDFALLERRRTGDVVHRLDGFRWVFNCAAGFDGGLWIASNVGVLRSPPGGGRPTRIPEPPRPERRESDPSKRRVFEDSTGRLWVARGRSICQAKARAAVVEEPSWTCQTVETMRHATAFVEPSPGVTWVATAGGGVLRRTGEEWQTIAASVTLPTAYVMGLRASPSGGVWVVTHGVTLRVEDRPDLPEGWKVLEELTGWHGIPGGGRTDLLELQDGTVWITTIFGAVRLPPEVRRPPDVPPRVELAEMVVDGRRIAPEGPVTLSHDRNRLELHFSALSYRDPGLLRYRIRAGRDQRWSDPVETPFIRFVDLSPGAHRVEVAASLDATRWSPEPAVLEFEVGRPWFQQAWFLGLATLLVAAGGFGVHRARFASLLRLERQRSRIARDLHGEMGSGLGSIGILAELASGDRLEESRRQALSAQIAQTVGELGTTLDEIVWSLRPGPQTLDALAAELAVRGRRMFPDGQAALRTSFPGRWPDVRLSPEVRRNVQRIAVEALHNAARHAGPRRDREPRAARPALAPGRAGRRRGHAPRRGRRRGRPRAAWNARARRGDRRGDRLAVAARGRHARDARLRSRRPRPEAGRLNHSIGSTGNTTIVGGSRRVAPVHHEAMTSSSEAERELRIAVVEDDPRFRVSLETLLSHAQGFRLAGSFGTPLALLKEAERAASSAAGTAWDIVLMDLQLPGIDGVEAMRRLKRLHPSTPVVVLTVFEEPATILDAICAGADGYLLKRTSAPEILDQLRSVALGGAPLTSRVARTVLDLLRSEAPAAAAASRRAGPKVAALELTERERDVLRCLVDGLSYKQAAAELRISSETVRSHVKSIYRKLQVHNVAEAVSRAIRERLT